MYAYKSRGIKDYTVVARIYGSVGMNTIFVGIKIEGKEFAGVWFEKEIFSQRNCDTETWKFNSYELSRTACLARRLNFIRLSEKWDASTRPEMLSFFFSLLILLWTFSTSFGFLSLFLNLFSLLSIPFALSSIFLSLFLSHAQSGRQCFCEPPIIIIITALDVGGKAWKRHRLLLSFFTTVNVISELFNYLAPTPSSNAVTCKSFASPLRLSASSIRSILPKISLIGQKVMALSPSTEIRNLKIPGISSPIGFNRK